MKKLERLKELIRSKKRLLVSFSGGVDSTLLLKVSQDIIGDDVIAVIINGNTLPELELESAINFVEEAGIRYKVDKLKQLDNLDFVKNSKDRCYHCKKDQITALKEIASKEGIETIADGLNVSDFNEHRPGILASDEEGVWHPFVEAGITKVDIRNIARKVGIPFWNKPSESCLATRIPYGERITEEKLRMIEEAESVLKEIGFSEVRVRLHHRVGRIEVPDTDIRKVLEDRSEIILRFGEIGIKYITLDLEGYRSGSMDEVL
ncbi:MAG: ATP-utilizing enzyme of the PP-loop superfamily [Candidatus Syntrophoarchaeum sp. GoM_oil]|nr:MAG: ATP-utilizing enzyme of the PP-loop superfamily [Candidatus Syntrophoarchaeum sp. GoM_oil]